MKKRLGGLAVTGMVLGAALVGYNLHASEPVTTAMAMAESVQDVATITVYKNPNCGCCADWADHLANNGFAVRLEEVNNLQAIKSQYGINREMASCHTAVVDGLVVEGHVPADDIKSYLANPTAGVIGLSVPGMPQGAPGMETGRKDDFSVLAFAANGRYMVAHSYENY